MLLFSDPEVKQKLLHRVEGARRPLLVTQVRQDRYAKPVDEREPFAAIEDVFGRLVDQVVVADDNTPEGMWRDPVGDLADRCFPGDRDAAYAAATGYMLFVSGRVVATVKKHGAPADDLWFLQELLARHVPGVTAPDARRRPGQAKTQKAPSPPRPERRGFAPPEPAPAPPPQPAPPTPWAVLGIAPGTPVDEAKRAFRALIAQYHPDKVSHLAPEFQALAEKRTREILDAWRSIEEGAA